jgi:hypothetical protein
VDVIQPASEQRTEQKRILKDVKAGILMYLIGYTQAAPKGHTVIRIWDSLVVDEESSASGVIHKEKD